MAPVHPRAALKLRAAFRPRRHPSYVELLTCLEMARQAGTPSNDDPPNGRVKR
jgi:hypothetical protein